MPGHIVHFEIPAENTAKEREFWGSLFGWEFETAPLPFEYHNAQITSQTSAAITNMEPGKRAGRAYFDVDDIDTGAGRVTELGGDASDRRPVPGAGWVVICTDPEGNDFGLWQSDPSVRP
jgi:uncharacterized protein